MAMEVMQVLTTITILYPTCMLDPEIYFELVNDTLLFTRINRRIQFHLFGGEVIWPGKVSVDIEGTLAMKFKKKEPKEWEEPFTPVKFNITNADIPKLWEYEIVSRKKMVSKIYIVVVRPVKRMYFHINIGHYIALHNSYRTREGKVVDFYRKFSPVPEMPIKTIDDPNPPPGSWVSMEMNLRLVARSLPKGSMGHYLLNRNDGSTVNFTVPFGTFFLPVFKTIENLHIITRSTGISAVLTLILYLFQMTNIKRIQILYFNNFETEIFLKEELVSFMVADNRLDVVHVIAKPKRNWRGEKGNVTQSLLEKYIPKFSKNTTSNHYIAICGHPIFHKKAERLLEDKLNYPDYHIHGFVGD